MELFGQSAVLTFDGPVVGVVGDVEDFVVILGFGPLELDMGLLEEGADS